MRDGPDQLYIVIRERSGGWDFARCLEEQPDWPAHAAFMDALASDGFALLVGPLEGDRDVLLVMRCASSADAEARLAADPWTRSGLLRTVRIARWTLRIGALP